MAASAPPPTSAPPAVRHVVYARGHGFFGPGGDFVRCAREALPFASAEAARWWALYLDGIGFDAEAREE